MDTQKLENDLRQLVNDVDKQAFIYDLLRAYKLPKASITRLQKGDYNQAKNLGEILWKKKLFFKQVAGEDPHGSIEALKSHEGTKMHQPRFLLVTDFHTLLAVDCTTEDSLDIALTDLPAHYDFFLPWAGLEKIQVLGENPADIKAAERMGRLYDILCEDNPVDSEEERHALNIFLSRLLFCFFAEDTGIFENDQFSTAVASHTSDEGSDLQPYLEKLFRVLSVPERNGLPDYLCRFPYVNGGLFAHPHKYPVPRFGRQARRIIIECGALNWKDINPDIFGSMIQAVVHTDQRGSLGMHYTSVTNIMKVIRPLFLDELYKELEKADARKQKGEKKKNLVKLLTRLRRIRIFDPACGSGNFLIIAYKELCKLEIEIIKRLHGSQQYLTGGTPWSNIKLTQFYGIELDDFAHETAKLSLWLAEHQMNMAFREVFGEAKPTLPLQDGGNIVCGNATRMDWEEVCPQDERGEVYILGNPPYLGSTMQSKTQKEDLAAVFSGIKRYKNLDYIGCWFLLGARYIHRVEGQLAFVTTNSISQGEQVSILWPHIFALGLEIGFAHQSFKWSNSAKGNAGVTCVIVGLRKESSHGKYLIDDSIRQLTGNVSPYLVAARNVFVPRTSKSISKFPEMVKGNQPTDGGNLILSSCEKDEILDLYPNSDIFVKKYYGSQEFLKGFDRWCIWITDQKKQTATGIPPINERIEAVKVTRLASKAPSTRKFSKGSHRFIQIQHEPGEALIIPSVSSERREYIPIGFLDSETVISNLAFAIYDPPTYIFAVISSRMHMTWVRTVAGRLKTDYRYSSALCYNTFPFPDIMDAQKTTLEDHVFQVLDERELHPEKTMAQLYDPDKMPDGLRQAHHAMDLAVEKCYRSKPFASDEERLEYLFKLYEEMIRAEGKA